MALIARGCVPWVLVPAVAAVAGQAFVGPAASVPLGILALLLAWFFRDPERALAPGIVSPADGRVSFVEETEEGTRVSIFMDPFDCHVNRAPLAGTVVRVQHVPGALKPAFRKDAEENERVETVLDTALGPVRIVQIAGIVARRIVPYLKPGDRVSRGQRIGIIRLGSRVDLYLPPAAEVVVRQGQTVKANATTVARGPGLA